MINFVINLIKYCFFLFVCGGGDFLVYFKKFIGDRLYTQLVLLNFGDCVLVWLFRFQFQLVLMEVRSFFFLQDLILCDLIVFLIMSVMLCCIFFLIIISLIINEVEYFFIISYYYFYQFFIIMIVFLLGFQVFFLLIKEVFGIFQRVNFYLLILFMMLLFDKNKYLFLEN